MGTGLARWIDALLAPAGGRTCEQELVARLVETGVARSAGVYARGARERLWVPLAVHDAGRELGSPDDLGPAPEGTLPEGPTADRRLALTLPLRGGAVLLQLAGFDARVGVDEDVLESLLVLTSVRSRSAGDRPPWEPAAALPGRGRADPLEPHAPAARGPGTLDLERHLAGLAAGLSSQTRDAFLDALARRLEGEP